MDSPLPDILKEESINFDGTKPICMNAGSDKGNGFMTDFEFSYPNDVHIYVGELDFEEDFSRDLKKDL